LPGRGAPEFGEERPSDSARDEGARWVDDSVNEWLIGRLSARGTGGGTGRFPIECLDAVGLLDLELEGRVDPCPEDVGGF
jgi:hypothetical protein